MDDLSIDETIGANLRTWRQRRGLTQAELSGRVGLSHQQIQKYELAMDRVPASRLILLARVLELPVEMFFAGVADIEIDGDPKAVARIQRTAGMLSELPEPFRGLLEEIVAGFHRALPRLSRREEA